MATKIQKKILKGPLFLIINRKYFIFMAVILAMMPPFSLRAEEHGAPPAAEGGEHSAPAHGENAEGGEGEGKEAAAAAPVDEFMDLNAGIEQLNSKIRMKNDDLRKLLVKKDQVKDPTQFKTIVEKIQKSYGELKEWNEELEKKKAVLRYRFPEKSFVKKANASEVKELEEVNAEAVLEEKTEELLDIVETQYQRPIRKKASKRRVPLESREPASVTNRPEDDLELNNPEDFTRSLILKK